MRMLVIASAIVLIAIAIVDSPLQSASFDCAKGSHPLEKTICQSPSLSALDSEVSTSYRAKLAQLFDKLSFTAQQREWQRLLRARCTAGCTAGEVEAEYRAQLDTINRIESEVFESSYKTTDVATLRIHHLGPNQFDFSIRRELDGELLCAIPASDSEAGTIATLNAPSKASWTQDTCTIDFLLTRDGSAHVSRIDVMASTGCRQYCRAPAHYGLGDDYLPANNWVAGNQ